MNLILADDEATWANLLPLTFTRPISELRIGILTIRQKWESHFKTEAGFLTRPHLQSSFPKKGKGPFTFVQSSILPDDELVAAIMQLKEGQGLFGAHGVIAYIGNDWFDQSSCEKKLYEKEYETIERPWDIFKKCSGGLKADFSVVTKGRKSAHVSKTVTIIGDPSQVFIDENAKAEACILNVNDGPVYLDKDSEIMEGCMIRGPFYLGKHSVMKMGAKVYGATSIGPECKVGGEVNNSVILGYSNKAHDGFLGNSVLGEWCNLGADTNNSNLKNNYANVKLYNYPAKRQVDTGLQFCGLIMGDHSKSGINTMFNTGTVVGVGCNVFGGGFPPTFLPDFSWGGSEGLVDHDMDKFFETAARVFERRGMVITDAYKDLLNSIRKIGF